MRNRHLFHQHANEGLFGQRGSFVLALILFVLVVLVMWAAAACTPADAAMRSPGLNRTEAALFSDSVRVTTPYTIPTQPDGIALDSAILVIPCARQDCTGPGTSNIKRKSLSVLPGSRTDVTNIPQPNPGECFAGTVTLTLYRKTSSKSASAGLEYCRPVPPLVNGPSVGPVVADTLP